MMQIDGILDDRWLALLAWDPEYQWLGSWLWLSGIAGRANTITSYISTATPTTDRLAQYMCHIFFGTKV